MADESDLRTFIANVLTDFRDGLLDDADEAVDAIMAHPSIARALQLTVIGPLDADA